jgi:spore coat polysaccharide biosynthesis predicted glycosyltransferase SpsG
LRIALAPDGGRTVGLGHAARCVALAEAFTALGERPIVVPPAGAARQWLSRQAVTTAPLGRRAWDLIVVDSYRITRARLGRWRRACRVLAVVDDSGRARVPARVDVLLRLAPGRVSSGRIIGGTRYVTLRREYWNAAPARIAPRVARVLVTLGGFPPGRLLATVRRAVRAALPHARVRALAAARGHRPAASLDRLMRRADLAVTAGGQTLLELLALGVPALVIGVAGNQRVNIAAARRARAAVVVGSHDRADLAERLTAAVARCAGSTALRRDLAARGRRLIDGQGALRAARLLRDRARRARASRA